jgi:hypothetical protein
MGAGRPKGSTGVNKSAVIREYITSHPSATTNEVVDALGKKGIDVSQALVAGVRARINGGSTTKKRAKVVSGEVTTKELNSVHAIVEQFEDVDDAKSMIKTVCDLVEEIGSIERLNETLKAYENWTPGSESVAVEDAEDEEITDEAESSGDDEEEEDEDEGSYDDDEEDED